MENLYQLYTTLGRKKDFVSRLIADIDNQYYLTVRPKKKFGDYQRENNAIRLRLLNPPHRNLKLVQQRICNHLQAERLPDCMYGSVHGSDNILNALVHIEHKFFLTIDLKNFFTNITNRQVHQALMDLNYPWEVARLVTRLTTHNGSVPQGAPSSPVLANLIFSKTAIQIVELIKDKGIVFTIFLDDLTFSSNEDFRYLIPLILSIIKTNHFFPNYKKIHYRRDRCEVTGLIVGNGELRLKPKMVREARKNERVNSYVQNVRAHYRQYRRQRNSANIKLEPAFHV